MNKIVSPWAAVAAFFIICAMVTAIVLSGHASALTVATTAVGGLVLAGIRVVRGNIPAPAPIDDAPTPPKPPSVPPVVGALFMTVVMTLVVACTKREEAKTAYEIQSEACVRAYDGAPHRKDCLDYVRNRWTEAGAPPAAQLDGGSHE